MIEKQCKIRDLPQCIIGKRLTPDRVGCINNERLLIVPLHVGENVDTPVTKICLVTGKNRIDAYHLTDEDTWFDQMCVYYETD